MSQFALSEERAEFKNLAREFSLGEIRPLSHKLDNDPGFPETIISKIWETGLVNFNIPEEMGGLGLGVLDACVILEELAGGCSGIAGAIEASTLAQLPIVKLGTSEQKEKFLQPLLDSPIVAGFGSGEPALTSLVVEDDGDSLSISGVHELVTNAGHAQWYLVFARKNGELRPFVIPADSEGLTIEKRSPGLGRKAISRGRLKLESVKLSQDCQIGAALEISELSQLLDSLIAVILAAGATGVASAAMHHAIEYAKQRQTFGRPIAQHQAVAFMIADMAREIEASRLMTWKAAQLIDSNCPAVKTALGASAYARDTAMRVTTDAVQVYGGYGYSREYPVEKLMRDAKQYQLNEGSPARARVVVSSMLLAAK